MNLKIARFEAPAKRAHAKGTADKTVAVHMGRHIDHHTILTTIHKV